MPDDRQDLSEEQLRAWFARYGPPAPDPSVRFNWRAWRAKPVPPRWRNWEIWAGAVAVLMALLLAIPRVTWPATGAPRPSGGRSALVERSRSPFVVVTATVPEAVPQSLSQWAVAGRWVLWVTASPPYLVQAMPLAGGKARVVGQVGCATRPSFDDQGISGSVPVLFCPSYRPSITAVLGGGGRFHLVESTIAALPSPGPQGVFVLNGFELNGRLYWTSLSGTDGSGGRSATGVLNLATGRPETPAAWLDSGFTGGWLGAPNRLYLLRGHSVYLSTGGPPTLLGDVSNLRIEAVGPGNQLWASAIPTSDNPDVERYIEEVPGRGVVASWTVTGYVVAYGPGWVAVQPDGLGSDTLVIRVLSGGTVFRFSGLTGPVVAPWNSPALLLTTVAGRKLVLIEPRP
jgi:hypothetical protein